MFKGHCFHRAIILQALYFKFRFSLSYREILQREPENKHDELAIKILLNDYLIGYIPRDSNEVIARLMDSGKNFYGSVKELKWQGSWAKIEIAV